MIQKTYTGGSLDQTRHYYYSTNWQVVEERVDSSMDAERQFVWGLRYIDDLICRGRDTSDPLDGTLDETLYALQDAAWNVTTITNTNGTLQERYAYEAYGSPVFLDASFGGRSDSAYAWETLFAGYRWDGCVRLYYCRKRYLAAHFGEYLSRDPAAQPTRDTNLYCEARNNPLKYLDPSGASIQPGRVIGPEQAIQTVELGAQASIQINRMAIDPNEGWLNSISANMWILLNDPTSMALTDISANFWAGIRTDAANKFVFTCECGWLDMGHFWASALAGYKTNATNAYTAGIMVEFHQEGWGSQPWKSLGGRSWHESHYTAEDLTSDWKGSLFGEGLQGSTVFDVVGSFKKLLQDCGAVPYNAETRDILEREAIEWSGRTLPEGWKPTDRRVRDLPVDERKVKRCRRMEDPDPVLGDAYAKLCGR